MPSDVPETSFGGVDWTDLFSSAVHQQKRLTMPTHKSPDKFWRQSVSIAALHNFKKKNSCFEDCGGNCCSKSPSNEPETRNSYSPRLKEGTNENLLVSISSRAHQPISLF